MVDGKKKNQCTARVWDQAGRGSRSCYNNALEGTTACRIHSPAAAQERAKRSEERFHLEVEKLDRSFASSAILSGVSTASLLKARRAGQKFTDEQFRTIFGLDSID